MASPEDVLPWPAPVTLTGQHVTLAPLAQDHADDLRAAAALLGPQWYTSIPSPDQIAHEIDRRNATPGMTPFAQLLPDGRAVGMTTYMHSTQIDRRVEIGSTWLSPEVQRSRFNTEAKLMLLRHAFENLGCIRVEFRTHRMNTQSRTAIERLGAQLEGILRQHIVMPDGTLRDTAVYAILDHEWPTIKTHLTAALT